MTFTIYEVLTYTDDDDIIVLSEHLSENSAKLELNCLTSSHRNEVYFINIRKVNLY